MNSEIKFGVLLDSIPKNQPGEKHFLATGKSPSSYLSFTKAKS